MLSSIGKSKGFTAGKGLFDRVWSASDKYIGEPMNKVAGKMGIESVWPTTLDRECDKAARILRVFTLDGGIETQVTAEQLNVDDVDAKKKRQKVIKRIPAKVLREAQGLAIFTVFRSGLGFSAASGSGIVIAKKPDGSWGSPSGLLVHTLGFGFMLGIDVYDVVLVLRTPQAVKSFTHPKVNLGGELALVAGPLGSALMADAGYQQAPCFSYVKSKGFYAGVQLDGSIIIERQDENARFYGTKCSAEQILAGRVHTPVDVEGLIQTIQAASDRDTKTEQIPGGLAPSEATGGQLDDKVNVHQPTEGFGAPPQYDDLETIKVKCSDCGSSMSMEELALHDCSSTLIRQADPAEKRRSVPMAPGSRLSMLSTSADPSTADPSTTEAPNRPSSSTATGTDIAESLSEEPPETPIKDASDKNVEHNNSLAAIALANVEDTEPALLKHDTTIGDLPDTLEEIKLDDDDEDALDDQIQMTVADDSLRSENTLQHA